jgi:uncharacterized protein (TIGR02145 family)
MNTHHRVALLAFVTLTAAACVVEEPANDDDDGGSVSSSGETASGSGSGGNVGVGGGGAGGDAGGSNHDFSNPPCPGNETMTDADGNSYRTVQMGNQCWMASDLNRGVARTETQYCNTANDCDGANEQCSHGQCSGPLNDTIVYKYCQDNATSCDSCAAYRWHEVMQGGEAGTRGVCPSGWRIPTRSDWQVLATAYNGRSNELLKFYGNSGFEGRVCGYKRDGTTNWQGKGTLSMFWAATDTSDTEAYRVTIVRDEPDVRIAPVDKNFGHYVRCIRE